MSWLERCSISAEMLNEALLPDWEAAVGKYVRGATVTVGENEKFFGMFRCYEGANVCFLHARASTQTMSSSEVKMMGCSNLYLLHLIRGDAYVNQMSKGEFLHDGDMIVLDGRTAFELNFVTSFEMLCIIIDERLFAALGGCDKHVATKIVGTNGWGMLASHYLASLLNIQGDIPSGSATCLAVHAFELMKQAMKISDVCGLSTSKIKASLFERIRAYIDNNFSDVELTPKRVAEHFCISQRYLHHLFSLYSNGLTYGGYLKKKRLQEAYDLLVSTNANQLKVNEVMYRCGYNDPVYFGKLFRAQYGNAPSAVRAGGLKANRPACV